LGRLEVVTPDRTSAMQARALAAGAVVIRAERRRARLICIRFTSIPALKRRARPISFATRKSAMSI